MAASADPPDLVVYVAQDCTGEPSDLLGVFRARIVEERSCAENLHRAHVYTV